MSKISKKVPDVWRGAVQSADGLFELYAMLPTNLGKAKKDGLYWILTEGPYKDMRFINNKDACDYLLKAKYPDLKLTERKRRFKTLAGASVNEVSDRDKTIANLRASINELKSVIEEL